MDAVVEAMQRSFLGLIKTKKKERIYYFRNVFKLVPVSNLAEIADKFTRNEILSSNEFRGILGYAPAADPKADELRNSNMPQPDAAPPTGPTMEEMDGIMKETFDGLGSQIDEMTKKFTNG
jgi:hypothetical protein